METSTSPAKRGRPPRKSASSHGLILDTVLTLLKEMPARSVSMELIARKAGVGKPTLYKWWPSRTALFLDVFRERVDTVPADRETPLDAEEALRLSVRGVTSAFNSFFGKFMADLVAEAQADPALLKRFFSEHIKPRREESKAILDAAIQKGQLRADTDSEVLIDALYGAVYYRLLLRSGPLDQEFADTLVEQSFRGCRAHHAGR